MPPSYKNATCLPCVGCEDKPLFPNARGGVFDADLKPISDAFLIRYYRKDIKLVDGRWDKSSGQQLKTHKLILPGQISGNAKHLSGKYIFAGYLFPHFGHFLLESLSNLWFIKQHPDLPLLWVGVHNQPDLTEMNQRFLDLYGIQNPIHIVTEETLVDELVVPEPGYVIHTRYSDAQKKALQVVEGSTPVPGKRIWLSRSKLEEGRITNEAALETILERAGWLIYHPQEHPLQDQLDMIRDAEVISGIEGSAFHLLMLVANFQGKIKLVARRRNVEFDFIAIADALGWDQELVFPTARVWSHGLPHWAYCRFWVSIDPVLDALDVKRSELPAVASSDSLTKISTSIAGFFKHRAALELWPQKDTIGASLPHCKTFLASPKVDFDTKSLPENATLLDITPDQLFTSMLLKRWPDFICVRHHDNEQELIRAFNCTLQLASNDALWVIEYYADERQVSPDNVVAQVDRVPSQNEQLLRYIASCVPLVSVARIRGANAAIVWCQPRLMFTSKLTSLSQLGSGDDYERAPVMPLKEAADMIVQHRTQVAKMSG